MFNKNNWIPVIRMEQPLRCAACEEVIDKGDAIEIEGGRGYIHSGGSPALSTSCRIEYIRQKERKVSMRKVQIVYLNKVTHG